MSVADRETAESGVVGQALIHTCWRAFQEARAGVDLPVPDWEELDEEYILPFSEAVLDIRDALYESEEKDQVLSYFALAQRALRRYLSVVGVDGMGIPGTAHVVAWEAVVRHLVNALDYDPDDHGDLAEHEAAWLSWSKKRMEIPDAASEVSPPA